VVQRAGRRGAVDLQKSAARMFPETQVRILPGCSGLPLFSIDSPRESAGSPSWAPEGRPRTIQPDVRSATGVDSSVVAKEPEIDPN